PLDPLDADEIREAARVVRAELALGPRVAFVAVTLDEPPKEAVLARTVLDRRAAVVLLDRDGASTEEVVVSLGEARVVSRRRIEGVQPPFLLGEFGPFVAAIKADERYRAALRKRGVDDLDLVSIDPVPYGHWREGDSPERRLCRATSFLRSRPGG